MDQPGTTGRHTLRGCKPRQQHADACDMDWESEAAELAEEEVALEASTCSACSFGAVDVQEGRDILLRVATMIAFVCCCGRPATASGMKLCLRHFAVWYLSIAAIHEHQFMTTQGCLFDAWPTIAEQDSRCTLQNWTLTYSRRLNACTGHLLGPT